MNLTLKNELDLSKNIYLYGAGQLTDMLLSIWPKDLKYPVGIVDKYKSKNFFREVPVYAFDYLGELKKSEDQLILSAFRLDAYELIEDVTKLGVEFAGTAYDIFDAYMPERFSNGWRFENGLKDYQNEINIVENILDSSESIATFHDVLNWRAFRYIHKGAKSRQLDESEKYINSITLQNISSANLLIDCGSFDGHFLINARNAINQGVSMVAFEPDPISYLRTCKKIQEHQLDVEVHQLAIGEMDAESVNFFSFGGLSSRVVMNLADSNMNVHQVSIDSFMLSKEMRLDRSVLKIHIEGNELQSLIGANKFIRTYRPMIMVNGSHTKDQLFKIPMILRDFGYKNIILRAHSNFGEGVVYYAFD